MKLYQFALALGVSFLLFFALYTTEKDRFDLLSQSMDPLEKARPMNDRVSLSSGELAKEFVTKDGDFVFLMPGSEVDFSDNNRELINGMIMFSSDFFSSSDFSSNYDSIFSPVVGQLKVGPLYINAPESSVFIAKESSRDVTLIYASNHSIDVYWRGAARPFVVPAGMTVSISENLINKEIGSMNYSQLKKEFSLKDFDAITKTSDFENLLDLAVSAHNKWIGKMEEFASMAPETWFVVRPNKLIGKIVRFIRTSAVFLPKSKKEEILFQSLVEPFVEAHYAVKNNQVAKAKKYLKDFETNYNGTAWKQLMNKDNHVARDWYRFVRAQKAWLNTIAPSNSAFVFYEFWNTRKNENNFEIIINKYTQSEIALSNKMYETTKEVLSGLRTPIINIPENIEYLWEITKRRRLLGELLMAQSQFNSKEIFETYAELIKKENVIIEKNTTLAETISLETAQDLLYLIRKILNSKNSEISEILKTLVGTYHKLDIDSNTIFTKEEMEILDFIKVAGSSGLTPSDIKAMQKQKTYQDKLSDQISNFQYQGKKTRDVSKDTEKGRIDSNSELKSKLAESGINTDDLSILKEDVDKLHFSNGTFLGRTTSGDFLISSQAITELTIGNKIVTFGLNANKEPKRTVKVQFLKSFLKQYSIDLQKNNTTTQTKFIPQNTKKAIFQKSLVQEAFRAEGYLVSRENITILDLGHKKFKLTEVLYQDTISLDMIFETATDLISNVKLKLGRKDISLGSQKVSRTELSSVIDSRMPSE